MDTWEPWLDKDVEILIKWWPHFGTGKTAKMLGMRNQRVKSKADNLGLKILPKKERLCYYCQVEYQRDRAGGFRCNTCHLQRRKILRREEDKILNDEIRLSRWIKRATNTYRYRSKGTDITCEYMLSLWKTQNGKCYYSNLPMITPIYGDGRSRFSASIDRIDSNIGYMKGNVVWCIWACNAGKMEMSTDEYIDICKAVVEFSQSKRNKSMTKILVYKCDICGKLEEPIIDTDGLEWWPKCWSIKNNICYCNECYVISRKINALEKTSNANSSRPI